MDILYLVMAVFAILGGIDYIIGSKFGIGKEFERGIMLLGTMMLTMVGMIVISPLIGIALKPIAGLMGGIIDPSVLPAILLANDMGGAHLAIEIANDSLLGQYNAFIVSAMMGATISFTVPYALGVVKREQRSDMLFGLLCGIVTIPLGCLVGGLIMGIPFLTLLINTLPLIIISAIISFGLIKFPDACVKIFGIFGFIIKALVIVGLLFGLFTKLTGIKPIPVLYDISVGTDIIINAACVMAGAFPLISIISRLLKAPLKVFGKKTGMDENSCVGIISTLATNATTFAVMDRMEPRGVRVNSAFAVSAAFVFAGHLAFTLAFMQEIEGVAPSVVPAYFVSKLVAGISAIIVALLLDRLNGKRAGADEVTEKAEGTEAA